MTALQNLYLPHMRKETDCFVLLTGSDTGDREFHLSEAKRLVSEHIGAIIKASSILETQPWGFESSTLFLNQALLIETELEPLDLLDAIQQIEIEVGRIKRDQQWSSRIIDIDILCTKNRIYHSERLIIPHKWLHKRSFALQPLLQVTTDWNHPLVKRSYRNILEDIKEEVPSIQVTL